MYRLEGLRPDQGASTPGIVLNSPLCRRSLTIGIRLYASRLDFLHRLAALNNVGRRNPYVLQSVTLTYRTAPRVRLSAKDHRSANCLPNNPPGISGFRVPEKVSETGFISRYARLGSPPSPLLLIPSPTTLLSLFRPRPLSILGLYGQPPRRTRAVLWRGGWLPRRQPRETQTQLHHPVFPRLPCLQEEAASHISPTPSTTCLGSHCGQCVQCDRKYPCSRCIRLGLVRADSIRSPPLTLIPPPPSDRSLRL